MGNAKDKVMWLMLYRMMKSQQHSMMRPLRIRATLLYVQAVKAARGSVMGVIGLCVLYILLFTGFAMFHVGLFLYLPWTLADKGWLMMWLGGGYFVATLLLCGFMLSQKRWMKMTGADEAVMKALEK